MIEVRAFEMMCTDKRVTLAALHASTQLVERFGLRFSLDCWDHRAIAAFVGDDVVGFLQYKKDEKLPHVNVSLAWCSPAWPRALVMMAGMLRAKARAEQIVEIDFTFHDGNETMARLADVIGARIVSHYCILELQAQPLPRAGAEPVTETS